MLKSRNNRGISDSPPTCTFCAQTTTWLAPTCSWVRAGRPRWRVFSAAEHVLSMFQARSHKRLWTWTACATRRA